MDINKISFWGIIISCGIVSVWIIFPADRKLRFRYSAIAILAFVILISINTSAPRDSIAKWITLFLAALLPTGIDKLDNHYRFTTKQNSRENDGLSPYSESESTSSYSSAPSSSSVSHSTSTSSYMSNEDRLRLVFGELLDDAVRLVYRDKCSDAIIATVKHYRDIQAGNAVPASTANAEYPIVLFIQTFTSAVNAVRNSELLQRVGQPLHCTGKVDIYCPNGTSITAHGVLYKSDGWPCIWDLASAGLLDMEGLKLITDEQGFSLYRDNIPIIPQNTCQATESFLCMELRQYIPGITITSTYSRDIGVTVDFSI